MGIIKFFNKQDLIMKKYLIFTIVGNIITLTNIFLNIPFLSLFGFSIVLFGIIKYSRYHISCSKTYRKMFPALIWYKVPFRGLYKYKKLDKSFFKKVNDEYYVNVKEVVDNVDFLHKDSVSDLINTNLVDNNEKWALDMLSIICKISKKVKPTNEPIYLKNKRESILNKILK